MFKNIRICLGFLVGINIYVYGLGGGPIQPEFASFEPVDVTDLVNLPTGDFSYTVPVGKVSSPSGVDYPIVASYHAGIQSEQEATWVGLGWNINTGSIVRILRGLPDDVNGDLVRSYLHRQGENNWDFSVGGGYGPIYGTTHWNNKGFNGITLGVGYAGVGFNVTNRLDGFYSAGMSAYNVKLGVSGVSNTEQADLFVSVGYGDADITLNSNGSVGFGYSLPNASFSLTSNGNFAVQGNYVNVNSYSNFTSSGLSQWNSSFSMTIPIYGWRVDFGFSEWGWKYEQLDYGKVFGYLYSSSRLSPSIETYNKFITKFADKSLWQYTNNLTENNDYNPTIIKLSGAKGNINADRLERIATEVNNNTEYNSSIFSSADYFSVNAQGLSGTFRAFKNKPITANVSLNKEIDGIYGAAQKNGNTWVINDNFNKDKEHFGTSFSDGLVFKMLNEANHNQIDEIGGEFDFTGTNIKKYENIDSRSTGTRIEPIFQMINNAERLSGFVVTDLEGKTYYFTQPLNSYQQFAYVNDKNAVPHNGSFKEGERDFSYKEEVMPYATTWLLTAITGPDYVKQYYDTENWNTVSEKLRPHQGDWGYWVNFRYEYGRPVKNVDGLPLQVIDESSGEGATTPLDIASYNWRYPYAGNKILHENFYTDQRYDKYTAQYGKKDITYLKSIESASEIAFFRTSPRLDAVGISENDYPKFLQGGIPRDAVSGYLTSGLPDGWARKHANVVNPNIVNQDYKNCMKVSVPVSNYDIQNLKFQTGQAIFDLIFTCTINTKTPISNKKRVALNPGEDSRNSNTLQILWDPSGWNWDANNKPVYVNENSARQVAPEILNWFFDDFYTDMLDIKHWYTSANLAEALFGYDEHAFIPYAKCFFFEKVGDNIVFYITSYKHIHKQHDHSIAKLTVETGLKLSEKDYYNYGGRIRKLEQITDVQFWRGTFHAREAINAPIVTLYQKKLDEIAWYSKSEYPYITSDKDPGFLDRDEPYWHPEGKPLPQAYKKVRFRYNYELAKNTPNSIDLHTKELGKGGRLTLKEIVSESGRPEDKIVMPPYLFAYNNTEVPYKSTFQHTFDNEYANRQYQMVDKWGYQITENEAIGGNYYANPNLGVLWNLKKIELPSCGSMEIALKRDHMKSSLGSIVKAFGSCYNFYEGDGTYLRDNIMPHSSTSTSKEWEGWDFYHVFTVNNYNEVENSITMTPTISGDYTGIINENDYFFLFGNTKGAWWSRESRYLFKINNATVQSDGTIKITFDKKISNYATGYEDFTWHVGVFRRIDFYCEGLKTESITAKSFNGEVFKTVYEYPETGGVLEALPQETFPASFYEQSWDKITNSGIRIRRLIQDCPFSPNIAVNYSSGNRSVLYPWVNVYNVNKANQKIGGSTKYYYYSLYDKLAVNGNEVQLKPFASQQKGKFLKGSDQEINLITIEDRSALIGQLKKIEYIENVNNEEHVIKSVERKYTFGDFLNNVYYNNISEKISTNKPLGLIRERTIRKDGDDFHISGVTDVSTFMPILKEETVVVDNIQQNTVMDHFDAMTGGALAKTEVNSGAAKKTTLSIPYRFIADPSKLAVIEQKNAYNLGGSSITIDGEIESNSSLQSFLSNSANMIKGATVDTYEVQTPAIQQPDLIPVQNRILYDGLSKWKGLRNSSDVFDWPEKNSNTLSSWLSTGRNIAIDMYNRVLSYKDPLTTAHTTIYLPYFKGVAAVIDNAAAGECAVFTCDYNEYKVTLDASGNPVDDGYYDFNYGWLQGQSELVNDNMHFGRKTCKISSKGGLNNGPFKMLNGIDKQKFYKFSAWVYPKIVDNNNPVSLIVERWNENSRQEIISQSVENFVVTGNKWQLIERVISPDMLKNMQSGNYLKIGLCSRKSDGSFGAAEFYVDDIRFHPKNALVNTYYYDHQLYTPVAFVDANNNAKYFEYDSFGRLIATGVLKN